LYAAANIEVNTVFPSAVTSDVIEKITSDTGAFVKTSAFKTSDGAMTELSKVYQKEVDYAFTSVASGLKTSDQAVDDAVHNLAQSGLKTVDYATGRAFQLDTAIRSAVQSTFSQLAGTVAQSNVEKTGVDYVEVSQSLAPRPSHAAWEGKIYTVEEFKKVCHYGETDNPAAIYAYNCHHNHYPYFMGISSPMTRVVPYSPKTINGKTYTGYELTQKQRAMERSIRAATREKNAREALDLDATDISELVNGKKAAYKKFSNAAGIKYYPSKVKVAS